MDYQKAKQYLKKHNLIDEVINKKKQYEMIITTPGDIIEKSEPTLILKKLINAKRNNTKKKIM